MIDTYLKLEGTRPIAVGCMRIVYPHPLDPALLVKVIRPDVIDQRWGKGRVWYKLPRRYGRFISYIREIQEYVATWARYGRDLHFVQKIIGLTDTDLGLGLVMRAAHDRAGGYARSLDQIVKSGDYTPEVAAALDLVCRQLLESDIVVSDPHAGNLVYAHSADHGNHFVLIDGLGNSNLFPFKGWCKSINRRSKLRRFQRLRRYIASIMPPPLSAPSLTTQP